ATVAAQSTGRIVTPPIDPTPQKPEYDSAAVVAAAATETRQADTSTETQTIETDNAAATETTADMTADSVPDSSETDNIVVAKLDEPPEDSITGLATDNIPTLPDEIPTAELEAAADAADTLQALQREAVRGNPVAQTRLGDKYFRGEDIAQDYDRALLWYRRAALQNYTDAQFNLGNMYLMGEGVLADDFAARDWYAKAAELGHSNAANNLRNLERRLADQSKPARTSTLGTITSSDTVTPESLVEMEVTEPVDTAEAETTTPAATTEPEPPAASAGRVVTPPIDP
ncbi:MAG: tetratricopeptide repeat protein, partial [Gammaproteobacteria bacterium]